MTTSNERNNKDRKIYIDSDYGLKFKPLISAIKEKAKNTSRGKEKSLVNRKSGSSISVRENGNINTVSSANSQQKMSQDGKSTDISHISQTVANKRKLVVDELTINDHKLNPKLYELTDMKSVLNDGEKIVGNLTMMGTVLVKAWEPTLEKYVMIRRQVRMPIFSPVLNTPDIHPNLSVDTELKEEFEDMADIESMTNILSDFSEKGSDQ